MLATATWHPANATTPELLRALVHRVHHLAPDLTTADHVHDTLAAHVAALRPLAAPDGVRRIPLHQPCTVPDCDGEYAMRITPGVVALDDLVCDRDPDHRLTPAEWQAVQRRTARPERNPA
jgi:hypothetical protein